MKFNAKKEVENVVEFIRNYFTINGLGGAVLGISGGKDSAVVAALLVKALGSENVVGLTLPCHSKREDKNLAKVVATHYGFRLFNVDLTQTFDAMTESIKKGQKKAQEKDLVNSNINLKPRLRMATVYYYAAMLSALEHKTYIVAGTSNKCELFVGYFTKGGDSVHDLSPIADFTVDEVIKMGEELNVPKEVLYRAPSDGLSGQTDEDKLGVSYADIAKYMEGKTVKKETKEKIERLHKNAAHKFNIPTYRR